jgi:uncharacterized membrane protein HdeD (DUF308 family)
MVFTNPAFYSLFLNGLLILIVFIYYMNNQNRENLSLLLLFSIAIGVHGLLHIGMDVNYKYNPIRWGMRQIYVRDEK